jgi:saposin
MYKLLLITLLIGIAASPAYTKEMVVEENSRSAVTCELCNLVLTAAKSLIASNKSEEAVVEFIENQLCARLGSLKDICTSYMETEGKQIIYELAHSVDPSTICTRIGLCSTRTVEVRTVNCIVCKLVMTDVQSMLKNNASEAQILAFIENKLCNATGPLYPVCKIAIDSFGPQILKMLAAQVDPAKICEFIGMCTSRSIERSQTIAPKSIYCPVCKVVIADVQTMLQNNASEAQILAFIESKLCNATGPLAPVCRLAIESFGPQILKMIAAQVDPEKVCELIGMCTAAAPKKRELVAPKSVNCIVCKLVMTDVQSMLKNNASEAQILAFIENKLCNATGPLYPVCKIAIDSFGPQILKMLAAQVDPAKICEFIGMCTSRTFVKQWILEMPKIESKNAVVCTICQYVVEFLDTQLKNNKTEAAIEHALENVCKIAPSSLRPQCTSLVDQYGIYLVELLIELADPLKVCQVANLC